MGTKNISERDSFTFSLLIAEYVLYTSLTPV